MTSLATRAKIVQLRLAGQSYRQIARTLNVSAAHAFYVWRNSPEGYARTIQSRDRSRTPYHPWVAESARRELSEIVEEVKALAATAPLYRGGPWE